MVLSPMKSKDEQQIFGLAEIPKQNSPYYCLYFYLSYVCVHQLLQIFVPESYCRTMVLSPMKSKDEQQIFGLAQIPKQNSPYYCLYFYLIYLCVHQLLQIFAPESYCRTLVLSSMKSNAEHQIFGLAEISKQNSLCRNISAYQRPH